MDNESPMDFSIRDFVLRSVDAITNANFAKKLEAELAKRMEGEP